MLQRADSSSAEAKKDTLLHTNGARALLQLPQIMTATSAALKDRKYCTSHHASVVLIREMLIAGDQSLAEAGRDIVVSCECFRYRYFISHA